MMADTLWIIALQLSLGLYLRAMFAIKVVKSEE